MTSSQPVARLLQPEQIDPELRKRAENRAGFADEYPFASRWFEVDGYVQHYIDEGQGRVLLMVHGNPTWSFAWRKLVKDLSRDHRVIAIDHLGCGFSEEPQDKNLYTLDGHIERLSALVRLLDLQNVCSATTGAEPSAWAARGEWPYDSNGFVLMNTGAFRSKAIPFRISLCRIPGAGSNRRSWFQPVRSRGSVHDSLEKPLTAVSGPALLLRNYWTTVSLSMSSCRTFLLQESHRSYATLAGVEQSLDKFRNHPVQLIWGMKDWCFTPKDFLTEFRRIFPQANALEIPDAGHYVFEDAPDRILKQVRGFLA